MDFQKFLEEAKQKINNSKSINKLLHDVKSCIFGKNSELTKMLAEMKNLSQEMKLAIQKEAVVDFVLLV